MSSGLSMEWTDDCEFEVGMSEIERRKLWVRAGGRCTLCKTYLLEGPLTAKNVAIGEGAHIVGQQATSGSPRGLESELSGTERDMADNILLACPTCHTEIDKALVTAIMTVDELRHRKKRHEDEIRHQTGMTADQRTTVLRVQGWVRGAAIELTRDTTSVAVIRSCNRFPFFMPSYDQSGIEIDLRHIDGEEEGSEAYYSAAMEKIRTGVRGRVYEGILLNQIDHLSVFAIARLPLLVYLGWMLDDGIATDVYQRHRSSGNWTWPDAGDGVDFSIATIREAPPDTLDAVLITNLSGTTHLANLPSQFAESPVFLLTVTNDSAHEDIISSPTSLTTFQKTMRRFFSSLEENRKILKSVHLFGGMPVSAAVTLGQSLKAEDLRPQLVLYDLGPSGYNKVMEF
jgi:hypothetical protein